MKSPIQPLDNTSMKRLMMLAAAAFLPGCFHHGRSLPAPIPRASGEHRTLFALRYIDMTVGTGARLEPRECVYAHYTGWLTDGKKFDSSRDTTSDGKPRTPISFPQGARRVIAGWDLGFDGMRVGGQRRLFIPYQLGYGEAGRPPVIPPKSELIFDVELMALADTLPRPEATPRGQSAPPPICPGWTEVSARR
jgi:peptidylprolyl isomerase